MESAANVTLDELQGDTRTRVAPRRFIRRGDVAHDSAKRATPAVDSSATLALEAFEAVGEAIAADISARDVVLPRHGSFRRGVDIILSAVGLVFASPLLALAAVAIVLDSRGGPFFLQERIGRGGRPFKMIKLRTMFRDSDCLRAELADENQSNGLFKIPDDPRITRVGKLLRKFHIDELPQFWNVLCGDMTIVGPRPLVPDEHAAIPHDSRSVREYVRPGITGPWQILGPLDAGLDELVALDVEYVLQGPSAKRDLTLVARTVGRVASGRGH
jgi:lipopolysaccharide/colanic/teichoic acid biosynthesis glycosyltransferase